MEENEKLENLVTNAEKLASEENENAILALDATNAFSIIDFPTAGFSSRKSASFSFLGI